jgi:hypothetical protein
MNTAPPAEELVTVDTVKAGGTQSTQSRPFDGILDDVTQLHELGQRRWFAEIMDSCVSFGALVVFRRVGGRENHHRRFGAPFTGPKVCQYLVAIAFWKVHVQKEKIGTWEVRVKVQAIDKGENLLAVADHAELTLDLVLAEGLAHEPYICGVILSE